MRMLGANFGPVIIAGRVHSKNLVPNRLSEMICA